MLKKLNEQTPVILVIGLCIGEKYYNGFDQPVARKQLCKHEYRQ
jgi:hypothetical protein